MNRGPVSSATPPRPNEPLATLVHRIARNQGDCVATRQLRAAGITERQISGLVRRGILSRVVRGVYMVGPPPLTHRRLRWAALLLAGPGAMLSHGTAAEVRGALHDLSGSVRVTVAQRRRERRIRTEVLIAETRRRGTIQVHHARAALKPDYVGGYPLTSAGRMMVDIAGARGRKVAERAWREADFLAQLRPPDVLRSLGRGRKGSRIVRRLWKTLPLVHGEGRQRAETEAEYLLLEAVRSIGLPEPLVNVPMWIARRTLRPDLRFELGIVEVHGGIHTKPYRRAEDRRRAELLVAHGWPVHVVDNDDVLEDPIAAAHGVAAFLRSLEAEHNAT